MLQNLSEREGFSSNRRFLCWYGCAGSLRGKGSHHSRSRMSRNEEESLRDISKRRQFSVLKLGKLGYKGNLLSRFVIAR